MTLLDGVTFEIHSAQLFCFPTWLPGNVIAQKWFMFLQRSQLLEGPRAPGSKWAERGRVISALLPRQVGAPGWLLSWSLSHFPFIEK